AERGYEDVNEHDIIRRAGVSTDEFRRRFADKQDCTIATVKATMDVFRWTLEVAYSSGCDWQSGLRASAWAAADYLDAHPTIVQVVAVDLLAARNEMLRVVREDALMFSAFLIERGRATAPDPEVVPAGAGLMAMGSIAQLLTHRLHKGGPVEPHEMVRPMLYMAVRTYRDEETAKVELHAPRPPGSFVVRPTAEN